MTVFTVAVFVFVLISVALTVLAAVGFHIAEVRDRKAQEDPKVDLSKCGGKPWDEYLPLLEDGKHWIKEQPCREVSIKSRDGLKLYGRLLTSSAPKRTVILFHGYRSSANFDFSCVVRFYLEHGTNVLLVDQRSHGKSDGKYIGYGVLERFDAVLWAEFAASIPECTDSIFLDGVSMGASTVLMAAGLPLPESVRGIIADCGFTSPKEIISVVTKRMHLPVFPTVPLISAVSRIFAGYGLGDYSTEDAMKKATVPILFVHGEDDLFVPCEMSRRNFAVCTSPGKKLVTVPGAGHGQSYLADTVGCRKSLLEFFDSYTV